MTPDEILTAVNAMTAEELTAKVAEFQGISLRLCSWCKDDGVREFLRSDNNRHWDPTKFIAHAWPLFCELSRAVHTDMVPVKDPVEDKGGPTYAIYINEFRLPWVFSPEEAPLAITRAWVWWKWCEKEGE